MTEINKTNLVRPGSDIETYEQLFHETWGPRPDRDGEVFIGDCVFLEESHIEGSQGKFHPAPPDHEAIDEVRELLDAWPEAKQGIGELIAGFLPLIHPELKYGETGGRGSVCGHLVDGNERSIYVTVYDPYGLYEGTLHEFAHLRMWACGIEMEEHDGWLIENDVDELFVSPVRKDERRPMTAVLQAFYSWVMLTEGGLKATERWPDLEDSFAQMMYINLPKIEEGILTIERHTEWTTEGEPYGEELLDWSRSIVDRGWDLVGQREAALDDHAEWVSSTSVTESPLH